MKEYRRENRLKRKRKAEAEANEEADADADMAAMMGFSGFGSSKK